jgi:hypothetical protein
MKLKFELVNGYGILIDEEAEIKEGDLIFDSDIKRIVVADSLKVITSTKRYCDYYHKIIFAEKELNLGVPVFEWKDFDYFYEIAKRRYFNPETGECIRSTIGADDYIEGFKEGYKSNPAKYTEEDLRKITQAAFVVMSNPETVIADFDRWFEKRLQSLQKYPKYVVMESEYDCCKRYVNCKGCDATPEMINYRPKLFINSEDKQQGVIKELIW